MVEDKKHEDQHFTQAPPKRSNWESFKIFLWNEQTGEFLGRSACNWAKILLFYVILYAFLAAFFAAMLLVFFQTLDLHKPKWQNADGLIGTNPGLGFRPRNEGKDVESTLIKFKHGVAGDWQHWNASLEKFLKRYDTVESSGEFFTSCSFDKLPEKDKVCSFDIKLLGNKCTKEEKFGYERGSPCVLLKLNRIYGWQPEPYTIEEVEEEKEMPQDLKEYIRAQHAVNSKQINMIWLSCDGVNTHDKENIGNVTYTPYRGFPAYYFPFRNTDGYLSPIVALQFLKPEAGVLISVECKVWAKNILRDRQRRLGSVNFEIRMD